MRLPICVIGLAFVIALVTAACGGGSASVSSPTGVGAGGSSISGLVVGGTTSSTASAGRFSMLSTHGITVSVNGTDISSPVDSSGQFTLTNVPTGPVTLTFSGSGFTAAVTIADVAPNEDVKITVTINGNSAHIDSEEHHGHDSNGTEVSGPISGLNASAQTFTVNTQLVHVGTTATIRQGDKTITFADLKNGMEVEVRGTMSGTTLEATDVKVDDSTDKPDTNTSDTGKN